MYKRQGWALPEVGWLTAVGRWLRVLVRVGSGELGPAIGEGATSVVEQTQSLQHDPGGVDLVSHSGHVLPASAKRLFGTHSAPGLESVDVTTADDAPVSYTHLDVYKRQIYNWLSAVSENLLGLR